MERGEIVREHFEKSYTEHDVLLNLLIFSFHYVFSRFITTMRTAYIFHEPKRVFRRVAQQLVINFRKKKNE